MTSAIPPLDMDAMEPRKSKAADAREVSPQIALNFLRGRAAINVLAREVGARVVVTDIGVDPDLP